MPLYKHKKGEQVRTVPGSAEDKRLAASSAWKRVDAKPEPEAEDQGDDAKAEGKG